MILTPKQTQCLDILEDKETSEVLFGGGAGGGKSAFGCYWILKNCFKYPGTRWVIGRAKLKTLKETTLKSFFEICGKQGIKPKTHYSFNATAGVFKFNNGSEVLLKDLFLYPSDPNFDELGSLEITGAFIDEANQVTEKAKNVLQSRIRFKLDENNLISKILYTCNPAKNWTYEDFYLPNKQGTLPKNRKFVQSLLNDNPHTSKQYRENLLKLDTSSIERLLHGNWEFDDDPSTLIHFNAIMALWTNSFVAQHKGGRYITADIALQGSDKFVVMVWDGYTVIHVLSMPKTTPDEVEKIIRELAFKYKVPEYRIVYDADGVGSYLRGYLKGAKAFVNNSKPIYTPAEGSKVFVKEQYKNLKSQCYFRLAKAINNNKLYIAAQMATEDKKFLTKELEQVKDASYGTDDVLAVVSKDVIRELIRRSPDFSDALMMRIYFDLHSYLSDPRDINYLRDVA